MITKLDPQIKEKAIAILEKQDHIVTSRWKEWDSGCYCLGGAIAKAAGHNFDDFLTTTTDFLQYKVGLTIVEIDEIIDANEYANTIDDVIEWAKENL